MFETEYLPLLSASRSSLGMESVNRVLHPFGAAFLASYASISVSPKLHEKPAKSQICGVFNMCGVSLPRCVLSQNYRMRII